MKQYRGVLSSLVAALACLSFCASYTVFPMSTSATSRICVPDSYPTIQSAINTGIGDMNNNGNIIPSGPSIPVSSSAAEPERATLSAGRLSLTPHTVTPFLVTLQYLNINPRQAYINQPVTITINAVNLDILPTNYKVDLIINGDIEQTRMVSIGPWASQLVKFTVTKSIPGSYIVNLGSQRGSFTILDTEANARAPIIDDTTIILIIMGILVIASATILALSFRRT